MSRATELRKRDRAAIDALIAESQRPHDPTQGRGARREDEVPVFLVCAAGIALGLVLSFLFQEIF